jgi:hypothetical protein
LPFLSLDKREREERGGRESESKRTAARNRETIGTHGRERERERERESEKRQPSERETESPLMHRRDE